MRKEVVFAIIAGLLFGLVIAFGVWRANLALNTNNEVATSQPAQEESEDSAQDQSQLGIAIAKPQNNQVITENPVAISGISKRGIYIVISTDQEDFILQTNQTGSFEQDVELNAGVNSITITAVDDDLSTVTEKLNLVYSTQFLENLQTGEQPRTETEGQESTESAIQERVEDKIDLAKNRPTSSQGIITDVVEETLQIENATGEIEQISTTSNTAFVNTVNTTEEIELEDVAIGDYIVAMGFRNGDSVLEAARVLVISPPDTSRPQITAGSVTETEGKNIVITDVNQNDSTLQFPIRWKGPEISEIDNEDKVIAISVTEDEETFIRTIEIIAVGQTSPTP
jgi:hypothetical protein